MGGPRAARAQLNFLFDLVDLAGINLDGNGRWHTAKVQIATARALRLATVSDD